VDDPFLPQPAIPVEHAERNPALRLVLHERGGHVGFLEGSPWRPSFWADEACARFLDATLTRF
jgi:predicted alpha/beta-fold hydrolase